MADAMDLEIVTPEGLKLRESVKELTAPGALGELGILPGHVAVLTTLEPGALSFQPAKGGGARHLAVADGYLQVLSDRLLVITEAAELKEDIDVARAKKALDDATKQLEGSTLADASFQLQSKRRKRAEARLTVAAR